MTSATAICSVQCQLPEPQEVPLVPVGLWYLQCIRLVAGVCCVWAPAAIARSQPQQGPAGSVPSVLVASVHLIKSCMIFVTLATTTLLNDQIGVSQCLSSLCLLRNTEQLLPTPAQRETKLQFGYQQQDFKEGLHSVFKSPPPSFLIMVLKIDQDIIECLIQGSWLPGLLTDKPEDLQIRLPGENDLSIVVDMAHILPRLHSKQSKTREKKEGTAKKSK
ncbi:hypothetical protein EK904_003491 [Melospiza melodia maxima]|nr:hypothetical protein EK904_003491 [Melospiza melodia maxima]